ncbi:MvaI/BcnI family restriction endonuclease [Bacillus sp. FJAT-26390]|uniref:MvaI/BcnI family restriction endonuclease n=1 Tax=Bacillus sp. FJAT-26390 TaxID=1743142 RepID=UPI00080817A8|nr:MvaI/BcnI family restriction endonuclease [Bacillus sp. FJAT-26390]OBZ10933.1 hypothetical protein A7975_18220 [Bacillus sp. FJAT-26390]
MNLFRSESQIEDVFCKVLTPNDDSGRHGVLIPVFAYWMFPNFPSFVPGAPINYEEPIVTYWKEAAGWDRKESKWKHYHRYPERRMTSLSPELLNNKVPGSLVVVAKLKGGYEYECLVISPQDSNYRDIGKLFKLSESDGIFAGASILPFSSLFVQTQSALDELVDKIKVISQMNYVTSLRTGDTGIGFTFETLLGIDANSDRAPDYKGIEIKTSRSKQVKARRKSQTGKQTLFSLIPNWGKARDRRGLIQQYGIDDPSRNRIGLYCTIKVVPNPYGWNLEIDESEGIIYGCRNGERIVYYNINDLKEALESKHKESVFVTAHSRVRDGNEEFHYDSIVHCQDVQFTEFIDMIKENIIGLDFAINQKPDGKVKDHGFLWRLDNKKYLLRLFKYVQEVL